MYILPWLIYRKRWVPIHPDAVATALASGNYMRPKLHRFSCGRIAVNYSFEGGAPTHMQIIRGKDMRKALPKDAPRAVKNILSPAVMLRNTLALDGWETFADIERLHLEWDRYMKSKGA